MFNKKKVCILVLTYNNYDDTVECVNSLEKLIDNIHHVIVIDNGSTDNSAKRLANEFPDIELISLPKNTGFSSGFNKGINYALSKGHEYIFLLNNDTIVAPDILTELLKVAELDPKSGILMPRILYYPPKAGSIKREDIWTDGGYFRKFPPGIVQKDNRKNINFDEPRLVEYASGCGLLVCRETFEEVGLLDTGYYFFFEDWDFSKRVREANLHIWSVPEAKMWHKVSKTTKKDNILYWRTMGESTIRFFRRYYSPFCSLIQIGYRILRDMILAGNLKYWKPFMIGVQKGFSSNLDDYPDIADNKNSDDAGIYGRDR